MKENRYVRNRIYIDEISQQHIKSYKVFLAGAGVGSVIAEALLRIGFENIVIADYDNVDASNLNRQNYTEAQIGQPKALALQSRLLAINPKANINALNYELTSSNFKGLLKDASVAINALDFTSSVPFEFDRHCQSMSIPVIHPYNIGWGGLVTVFLPNGDYLADLANNYRGFEIKMVEHALKKIELQINHTHWIRLVLEKYLKEGGELSPPQLSIGCNILAAQCTSIIYKLAIGEPIKVFPEFYFYSTLDDDY